jgi:hypothetical protein
MGRARRVLLSTPWRRRGTLAALSALLTLTVIEAGCQVYALVPDRRWKARRPICGTSTV